MKPGQLVALGGDVVYAGVFCIFGCCGGTGKLQLLAAWCPAGLAPPASRDFFCCIFSVTNYSILACGGLLFGVGDLPHKLCNCLGEVKGV